MLESKFRGDFVESTKFNALSCFTDFSNLVSKIAWSDCHFINNKNKICVSSKECEVWQRKLLPVRIYLAPGIVQHNFAEHPLSSIAIAIS